MNSAIYLLFSNQNLLTFKDKSIMSDYASATVLGQAFGMIDVVGILCIVGAVTALTVVDA